MYAFLQILQPDRRFIQSQHELIFRLESAIEKRPITDEFEVS